MLPLVLLVMWVFILPKTDITNTENAFPLFLYILQALAKKREVLMILSVVLIVFQAFFLTEVINRQNVLRESSHLPALMYIILMSCFPEQLSFNPLVIANFFIIIFLNSLFNFYKSVEIAFDAFDAGLFIGIATLFYWPSIFLFPLIWSALIVLRTFVWREWAASLIGIILPFIYFGVLMYWYDQLSVNSILSILAPFYSVQFSTEFNTTYIILFVILAVIAIASIIKFFQDLNTYAKLKTKKFLALFVWFFLFATFSYLVSSKKTMISLSFLAIPLSVIMSNYFLSLKKQLLAEAIFIVLLIAVVYNQVQYFLQFSPFT
jgi:hypothetical protein